MKSRAVVIVAAFVALSASSCVAKADQQDESFPSGEAAPLTTTATASAEEATSIEPRAAVDLDEGATTTDVASSRAFWAQFQPDGLSPGFDSSVALVESSDVVVAGRVTKVGNIRSYAAADPGADYPEGAPPLPGFSLIEVVVEVDRILVGEIGEEVERLAIDFWLPDGAQIEDVNPPRGTFVFFLIDRGLETPLPTLEMIEGLGQETANRYVDDAVDRYRLNTWQGILAVVPEGLASPVSLEVSDLDVEMLGEDVMPSSSVPAADSDSRTMQRIDSDRACIESFLNAVDVDPSLRRPGPDGAAWGLFQDSDEWNGETPVCWINFRERGGCVAFTLDVEGRWRDPAWAELPATDDDPCNSDGIGTDFP